MAMNLKCKIGWLFTLIFTIIAFATPLEANEKLVAAAKKEGKVILYHSISRQTVTALSKKFTEKYGIEVKWTRKNSGGIARMLSAEQMAGVLKCDIVSNGDSTRFVNWKKQNLLTQYKSPNTAYFRQGMADPDNFSAPSRCAYGAIGYSTKRISKEEAPKGWKDVLDPKWKGRIGLIDPVKSGPGTWWLMSMVKYYGWGYIEELSKNKPLLLKSSSNAALTLISGEVDLTIPGSEHNLTARLNKGEPVGVIYPKEGLTTKVSRTAICANSPHPNAAKLWLDFETSAEGQTIIDEVGGYPSTRSDVESAYKRPPGVFDPKNTLSITDEYIIKNKKEYSKKFYKLIKISD